MSFTVSQTSIKVKRDHTIKKTYQTAVLFNKKWLTNNPAVHLMTNVLVFRTNINSLDRLYQTACLMCHLRHRVSRWNVDMEDCDCVLRIETDRVSEAEVVRLVRQIGLNCDPLD